MKVNKTSNPSYLITTSLGLVALAFSSSLAAAVPQEATVTAARYAGGDKIAIRWVTGNPAEKELSTFCGFYPEKYPLFGEEGFYHYYVNGPENAIFARPLNGEYQQVIDLGESSDRHWFGSIPGLSESTPVEIQVRMKDMLTGAYCEPDAAAAAIVNTVNIDTQPSFDYIGDVLLTDISIQQSSPPYIENYWVEYRYDNWASNFNDNDGGSQTLLRNSVYSSPYGLDLRFESNSEAPSTDLIGSTWNVYNREQTNTLFADALNVLQICNTDDLIDQWVGTCSDEVAFVSTAGPHAPGAENMPSFVMSNSLEIGDDYSMQEHLAWATNLDAGANATPSSSMQFHTVWVTNSALFEVAPWISYPSSSLRFKFKEGVSGASRVYVSLSDWDLESPENKAHYISRANQDDLAPDHSRIQYVEISVGDSASTRTVSSGSRGLDLVHAPITDGESNSSGGGGTGGFALFALLGLALARRR